MDEPVVAEPAPEVPTIERTDGLSRVLATTALGLAVLSFVEIGGTIAVGLSVTTDRLSFVHRQGYAFLTQLEKSPVALMLVVAAVFAAITAVRAETDSRTAQMTRIALWVIGIGAVLVGLGAVLAVLARFRVAELTTAQPIDSITRRVLFTFIVRNFGCAVLALLISTSALFRPGVRRVVG